MSGWRIAGSYFESCNCDAICPCRTVGERRGGRSTHGVCHGVLSWLVEDGRAGDVDLSGLAAAFTQIQDPAVSLVPRVAAVGIAIVVFAPAIAHQLAAFAGKLWPLITAAGTG